FLKYQAISVEQDDVEILVTNIINPASFLSGVAGEPVSHDCLETIEAVYSSHLDLKEEPLKDAEDTWYTDRSSFVRQGTHKAGYAVTTVEKVIEAKVLPPNTLAQKAEIIALTRALELAIWKERGLLSTQGKSIKHAQEILRLLEAVQQPEKVAIMHCHSHQRGNNAEEMGNALADREAKQVAENVVTEGSLNPDGKIQVDGEPKYSKGAWNLINGLGGWIREEGWAFMPRGKLIIPSAILWAVVMAEHRKAHWGTEALCKSLMQQIVARKLIYHNKTGDPAM
ncbi:uncharacterized protein LOC116238638, partial [Phasianus colchicus]|uniref:uncharacterized protein LOC116238638 n=1 Tax=Phasianus colchicus TaxID=9054 RepID=UPI00129D34AD